MADRHALRLTLVGRRYCSLCDKMREALSGCASTNAISLELLEIDLDEYPQWEDQFGERVPILMLAEMPTGVEICHYHFDETAFMLHAMPYGISS